MLARWKDSALAHWMRRSCCPSWRCRTWLCALLAAPVVGACAKRRPDDDDDGVSITTWSDSGDSSSDSGDSGGSGGDSGGDSGGGDSGD